MAPVRLVAFTLSALLSLPSLAADGETVFARVTTRAFGHQEEVSIRFTPDKAVLVLNSNFLQEPGRPVRLGSWEAPMNEALSIEYRELLLRKKRMESKRLPPDADRLVEKTAAPYQGHGFHYFVGETEVGFKTAEARHVGDLLADPWKLAQWKPLKAIEVTPEHARKLACKKHSPTIERCVDGDFGIAYLQRAPRQAGSGAGRPGVKGARGDAGKQ